VFDFRYHALTIVAVFLALLVGLLLGVAIGDKGLVSSAETSLRSNLRSEIRDANARADDLRGELGERTRFERAAYGPLVANRLPGVRVGIVALGGLSGGTVRNVRDALKGTGAETLTSVSVVHEPLDRAALASAAAGTRYESLSSDDSLLQAFGFRIGTQFVQGGSLLTRVRAALLGPYSGTLTGLDAVILEKRTNKDLKGDDAAAVSEFEQGLINGMTRFGTPVVGIERSDADPSQVGWYTDRDLASVDNVDQLPGRAALVLALASRRKGAFGFKPSAETPVPLGVGPAGL
jgi:copper transport outer membrane protein MctB